ncbi:MAG: histidine kinase [Rubrobacteraceae bacterium]
MSMSIRPESPSSDTHSKTRPVAVRFAWPLCAASLALLGLSVLFAFLGRPAPLLEESAPWHGQAIYAAGSAGAPVLGALIASRRPDNPYGWLWLGFGMALATLSFGANYAEYAALSGNLPAPVAAAAVGSAGWVAWVALTPLLMLLFPDGRLPSSRWRFVAWITVAAGAACVVLAPFMPGQSGVASVENPFGVGGWIGDAIMALVVAGVFVIFGCTILSAFSLVFRFRRAEGTQRRQIKWFAYAAVILGGSLVFSGFLGRDLPGVWDAVFEAATLSGLYVAVGIAIFRHRLYDIDLIINRTLVYGVLSACVVGIYVLVVGYLGAVFQTGRSLAISLVAAGLVAVLFAPLRDRLQRGANRLMYGERDDPYAVISRLGERMEATLEPEAVLPTIALTLREALKLPYAAIELREGNEPFVAAEEGSPTKEEIRLPLAHHGEEIGALLLAPRPGEDGFSPADRRLLEDLARQAGAAAHAVRLTKDLQRSRERLVSTREEERRRLRRDLHDGLGPALGSLPMKLDVASDMIENDPTAARALLHSLKKQTRSATSDVRRLVHELRPPALDELGLAGAIREVAAQQNGLRVTVEAPENIPPLPAAVEVAAYRIAGEAMANAARHAHASRCEVRLALDDGSLRLEISDDGCGIGEDRGFGVGLHSMRERAEELGGTFGVGASAEGGATVRASLPLGDLKE